MAVESKWPKCDMIVTLNNVTQGASERLSGFRFSPVDHHQPPRPTSNTHINVSSRYQLWLSWIY